MAKNPEFECNLVISGPGRANFIAIMPKNLGYGEFDELHKIDGRTQHIVELGPKIGYTQPTGAKDAVASDDGGALPAEAGSRFSLVFPTE